MSTGALEKVRYLDRRLLRTSPGVTVAVAGGFTTWTLPYSVAVDGSEGSLVVCVQSPPSLLTVTRPAANQVQAAGDYSATDVFIGVLYEFKYVPSTFYLRDQQGNPKPRGRLNLRYLDVFYADTTDLSVRVTPEERAVTAYPLALSAPDTDRLRVPIQSKNKDTLIEFLNGTPGGCSITGLDWEAFYHDRSRQV